MSTLAALIAIEGLAGTGKTTVANAINQTHGCIIVDEFPPDFIEGHLHRLSIEDPTFPLHKQYKTPIAQTLLLAANAAFKIETACQLEASGKPIILDRYIDSVIAYQKAVIEITTPNLTTSWIAALGDVLPKADLVFFLDCPTSVIQSRLKRRGIFVDDNYLTFLDRVRECFDSELSNRPEVVKIDATKNLSDVITHINDELTHFPIKPNRLADCNYSQQTYSLS